MAKVSEAQAKASKKWDDENRERKRYINARSAANGFINKRATLTDLLEIRNLINGKIDQQLTTKKIISVYNWFMNLSYTSDEVSNMNSEKWKKIVDDAQENFSIARNNNYFKVVHYSDIEPDWSKGTEPELKGYTYIKDFYFGTSYYIFKKNDK